MKKFLKWFGGRKFFLAIIILIAGIVLSFFGKLTTEFVAMVSLLGGWYAWGNSKTKEFSEVNVKNRNQ